jgi:hypothetical protein
MPKSEVVKAEVSKKEVATLAEGMDLDELIGDAGAGPQMDLSDLGLPYLYLLQGLSPQVNRASPKYIQGAMPGMFYNHISMEIFEGENTGLMVVPCHYERKISEWIDRDAGGGWVMDHSVDSNIMSKAKPDQKKRMRLISDPTHILVETAFQYVLVMNPVTEVWEQVCIPMKSTALRTNRRWNKLINDSVIPGTQKKAPRFLFPYALRSIGEQSGDNYYFNFDIEQLPQTVNKEVYEAAKKYYQAIEAGAVKRSTEDDGPIEATVVAADDPDSKLNDEIPF